MYIIEFENFNDDSGVQVLKTFVNLKEAKKGIHSLFLNLVPEGCKEEDEEYYNALVEKLHNDANEFIEKRTFTDEDAKYKLKYIRNKKN